MLIAVSWGILAAEVIHQLLNVTIGLLDRSAARALVRQQLEANQGGLTLSDGLLDTAVIVSVIGAAVISLAILGLIAWLLTLLRRRHRWAGTARRLVFVFAAFCVIRGLLILVSGPAAGSTVPVAWFAVDGSVQILSAVAGVIALLFVFREDTLRWTGELDRPDSPTRR